MSFRIQHPYPLTTAYGSNREELSKTSSSSLSLSSSHPSPYIPLAILELAKWNIFLSRNYDSKPVQAFYLQH
ncbi:hypothetical protein C5167_003070 [Papaver somniferum]|uniref:Uncharacterized protein n=1 Tax=Papaver somniferum TaxID=3469 RepID=A0A4Y7L3Q8_PAPSO|nr:hypothetical protein C5167_003070 [Papaver somniferum]